jgi:hypothetical protein
MEQIITDSSVVYFSLGVIVGVTLSFMTYFAYLEMLENQDDAE